MRPILLRRLCYQCALAAITYLEVDGSEASALLQMNEHYSAAKDGPLPALAAAIVLLD